MTRSAVPYPIACVRETLEESVERREYVAACLYARDTFDITTRCLLALLVLDGIRFPSAQGGEFLDAIAAMTAHRAPSHGYWVQLLERIAKAHTKIPQDAATMTRETAKALMVGCRGGGKSEKSPINLLKRGVVFRNAFAHGALGADLGRLEDVVREIVRDLDSLFELVAPIWASYRWELSLEGDGALALDQATLATLDAERLLTARVAVRELSADQLLSLHPLVRLVWIPEINSAGVAVFEKRCFSTSGRYASDRYIDYATGRDSFVSEYWEIGDTKERAAAGRDLAALLNPDARAYHAPLESQIQNLRLGLSDHAAILPRTALAKKVQSALSGDKPARLITLTAAAGLGKSWFAAGLPHGMHKDLRSWERQTVVIHLVGGSRQSASWFTDELKRQVLALFELSLNIRQSPTEVDAWREAIARAFEVVADGFDRLLVVVDGADEILDASSDPCALDILPAATDLPDRVHLLLTSRPVPSMGQRARSAWTRLTESDLAAEAVAHLKLFGTDADQVQLVREVLKDHQGPATDAMIDACQGSALRARHLRRLMELNPSVATDNAVAGFYDKDLYDAYFAAIKEVLGPTVWTRVHSPLLSALGVSAQTLPLDVIADIIGAAVEEVYLAALDLRDCLVSTRFKDEALPSLAIGHTELRDYICESPELFDEGSRKLAPYVLRQCDDSLPGVDATGAAGDQEAAPEYPRLAPWLRWKAMGHLALGLEPEALNRIVQHSIARLVERADRTPLEAIVDNLGPSHAPATTRAVPRSCERLIESIESRLAVDGRAMSLGKLRRIRLHLHWRIASFYLAYGPTRDPALSYDTLNRAERLQLVLEAASDGPPGEWGDTASHRYKQFRAARSIGKTSESIKHLRESIRIRHMQLQHEPHRADIMVASIDSITELLAHSNSASDTVDAWTEEERSVLHSRAERYLIDLGNIPQQSRQAIDHRLWLRKRFIRLATQNSNINTTDSLEVTISLMESEQALIKNRMHDDSGDAALRFSVISSLRHIALTRSRIEGRYSESVADVEQARRLILPLIAPGQMRIEAAEVNLRLSQTLALLHAREGQIEKAMECMSSAIEWAISSSEETGPSLVPRVNQLRTDMRKLMSGNVPIEYRPGVSSYDTRNMDVVGTWSPQDSAREWHFLEWPIGDFRESTLQPGKYRCIFIYVHGEYHMEFERASLMCGDTVLAEDVHHGHAGFYHAHNDYTLLIPDAVDTSRLSIRANVKSAPDSNGIVVFGRSDTNE